MSFTKKEIESKKIGIIDIGTYKIRVAIIKLKNKDFELIGYGEKRQNYKINSINDLNFIKENIKKAIKKAEKDGNICIEKIIINTPFEEIFFEKTKINYIRKNENKEIDISELNEILLETKKLCFKKAFSNINQNNSYKKDDLKLLISNIDEISIDKKKQKKLLNCKGKEISISILNVFMPRIKYEIIELISKLINKKIYKIIPTEYSLSKLSFEKKDIIIIDFGNSYTSIIVKNNNKIIGVKKVAVGINDLIKEISIKYKKTKIDIINTIDDNVYLKEKKGFLDIFKDLLIISLEEIIKDKICPNHFFITGGGSNNFIKQYLKNIDFNQYNIKIAKKIKYIIPNIENININELSMSNLNIYSMMKASVNFIKKQKDPIEESLKKVMSNY